MEFFLHIILILRLIRKVIEYSCNILFMFDPTSKAKTHLISYLLEVDINSLKNLIAI